MTEEEKVTITVNKKSGANDAPPEDNDAEIAPSGPYGDYAWPKDMYTEMMDMSNLAFICYTFAYLIDVSRKVKERGGEFKGLSVDGNGARVEKEVTPDTVLKRSFTPGEIKDIIIENQEELAKHYDDFKDPARLIAYLDEAQERADSVCDGCERPLTLEEFDDKHQKKELVYAITKDNANKRITLVFRGTENSLAFQSNWLTNIRVAKEDVPIPDALKGKVDGVTEITSVHRGFYEYLFKKTVDTTDAEDRTKYDEILEELKSLLAKYPDHKLYVTGHSLGAALSSVASFYLACDPDIPKPVSCINFASPRVSGSKMFKATQYLEKTKQLRILRSVNENDLVTAVPSLGFHHVGFQVTAYKKGWFRQKKPDITYPKPNDGFFRWSRRAWSNSILTNLNIAYDHGGYRKRIEEVREILEEKDLNSMYADPLVVGYNLE